MLADQLDYIVGVDPHRDAHALAVIGVRSDLRVCDHAPTHFVRCSWPAGARARVSQLCARPPAIGLRRCAR